MTVQAQRAQYLEAGDVVEACVQSSDGAIDLGVRRNRVIVEESKPRMKRLLIECMTKCPARAGSRRRSSISAELPPPGSNALG